jgi:hypothetical protein
MMNRETGQFKISKAKAEIVKVVTQGCETKHVLQYSWNIRDVKESGTFKGWFEIKFNGDIKEEGVQYPTGNLIVPIEEELVIYVN